jgi:hypothetical protein
MFTEPLACGMGAPLPSARRVLAVFSFLLYSMSLFGAGEATGFVDFIPAAGIIGSWRFVGYCLRAGMLTEPPFA